MARLAPTERGRSNTVPNQHTRKVPAQAKSKRPAPARPERERARRPGSLAGASVSRARLIEATRALACEQGYAAVTVTALLPRAGVSSKTFYEHFENAEDCFTAAFAEALRELRAAAMPVYQRPGPWAQRVRAALATLLAHLDGDRQLAVFVFLEAPKAGAAVQERRRQIWELLSMMLDGARNGQDVSAPPVLIDEVLVQGAISVIRARLAAREPPLLSGLLNQLMAAITYSYLGAQAAADELQRPFAPPPIAPEPQAPPAPRLTYRTMRVLAAIAARPGTSNREVADAAGITDQGQISRLLSRLQTLELIANDAGGEKWAPNRWRLSERGEQLERAIRHELH